MNSNLVSDFNCDDSQTQSTKILLNGGSKLSNKWHKCGIDGCDYGSRKKSNVEGHKTETHLGQKNCVYAANDSPHQACLGTSVNAMN